MQLGWGEWGMAMVVRDNVPEGWERALGVVEILNKATLVGVYAFHLSIRETEAEGSLRVGGWPELPSKFEVSLGISCHNLLSVCIPCLAVSMTHEGVLEARCVSPWSSSG